MLIPTIHGALDNILSLFSSRYVDILVASNILCIICKSNETVTIFIIKSYSQECTRLHYN